MTASDTLKQQSILGHIERHFAGKPNPTDDEMVQAIEAYARG